MFAAHSALRVQIPLVSRSNAGFEIDTRLPAHFTQLFVAHQLARRPIGFALFADDPPFEIHDSRYELRQIADADVLPGTDVDVFIAGVMFGQKNESIGAIVRM